MWLGEMLYVVRDDGLVREDDASSRMWLKMIVLVTRDDGHGWR